MVFLSTDFVTIKPPVMSYLLIKKDDTKIFKAFMSGSEVEVGVVVPSQSNVFSPGEVIDIFYGNTGDSYEAKVVKQKRIDPKTTKEQSFLMVSFMKRK